MAVPGGEWASVPGAGRPLERLKDATSVNEIAQAVADHVREVFSVDFTSLYVWDAAAGVLKLAAFRHQAHWAPQQIFTPGNGLVGTVLQRRATLLVGNYLQLRSKSARAVRQGVASALGAPVMHEGEVVAVIAVGGRVPNRFNDADAKLLERIADDVAPALGQALRQGPADVPPMSWHSMRRQPQAAR